MKKILVIQGKAFRLGGGIAAIEDGTIPPEYRRLTGIVYDGNVWYDTGLYLHGSDTIRFSFAASKACNVLGCYTSADAQTNYSLYVTTSSTGKYLRYNGGTYSSYFTANTRYNVVVAPTGSQGMRTDSTWTEKSFTTPTTMLIGSTSVEATSAKMTGTIYGDIVIDETETIIPAERISDGHIGYYLFTAERFIENLGTGTPVALGYVDNNN